MKIVFRVDASSRIGMGHAIRCLTLADRLTDLGAECIFVMRQHEGHICEEVRAIGFSVKALVSPAMPAGSCSEKPSSYSDWLGISAEVDAHQSLQAIGGMVDWLVVDHYALDHRWEGIMRGYARKIAVIDDLADRKHDCDLLLDQNFFASGAERYAGLVPQECIRLSGPWFALLQKDYRKALLERSYDAPIRSVMVFYGGSDSTNETCRAVRILAQEPFLDLEVHVVIGVRNRNRDRIESLCAHRPGTKIYEGLKSLADLMVESDLVLGAGGTSTWERCALGLPAVVTAIADNQLPVTKELIDADLIYYAGDWRSVSDSSLRQTVLQAVSNREKNYSIFRRSRTLTDAYGAERVAECLMPSSVDELMLKPATMDHRQIYFHWINDPSVRTNAFNSAPVIWQEHSDWFDKKLADPSCHMWILMTRSGLPIGQVRLEPDNGAHLIDFSVDNLARGRGYGSALLTKMLAKIREMSSIARVTGEVKTSNMASLRAFRKTGAFQEAVDASRQIHVFSQSDRILAV